MAKVKLRCIMGCPELKSSYREKGLVYTFFYKQPVYKQPLLDSYYKKPLKNRNKKVKQKYRYLKK